MHYHLIACWIVYTNWTIIKMRRQLDQLTNPQSCLRSPHHCCSCTSGGIIVTSDGDSQPDIIATMNDAISDVDEAIKLLSDKVPNAGMGSLDLVHPPSSSVHYLTRRVFGVKIYFHRP